MSCLLPANNTLVLRSVQQQKKHTVYDARTAAVVQFVANGDMCLVTPPRKRNFLRRGGVGIVEIKILNHTSEIVHLLLVIPGFDSFREVRRPRNCAEGGIKKPVCKVSSKSY